MGQGSREESGQERREEERKGQDRRGEERTGGAVAKAAIPGSG